MGKTFLKAGIIMFVCGVVLLIILAFLHDATLGGIALATTGFVCLAIGGILSESN